MNATKVDAMNFTSIEATDEFAANYVSEMTELQEIPFQGGVIYHGWHKDDGKAVVVSPALGNHSILKPFEKADVSCYS